MLTLKTIQLCVACVLLTVESLGLLVWLICPNWLIPWPVSKEIINTGYCKASKRHVIVNISIQVNPMAHFFSGAIPRMMNGYIHYESPPVFNFADHCGEETKPQRGQNLDYDDGAAAQIVDQTNPIRDEHFLARREVGNSSETVGSSARNPSSQLGSSAVEAQIEFNDEIFAECTVIAIAICVNILLLVGTWQRVPLLFLPWMLIYGFELLSGWAVTLAFLLLPDWFRVTAIVSLARASFLTWAWICIVRRHMKEVTEIVQRPKLQTIISIATAHPFTPRPDMMDISVLTTPNSQKGFFF